MDDTTKAPEAVANPDALGPWEDDGDGGWDRYSDHSDGERSLRIGVSRGGLYSIFPTVGIRGMVQGHDGTRRDADLAFLRLYPGGTLAGGVFGEEVVAPAAVVEPDPFAGVKAAGAELVAANIANLTAWHAHNAACERLRIAEKAWRDAIAAVPSTPAARSSS